MTAKLNYTEDYRPGAVGVPAWGYGPFLDAFQTGPQPQAAPHTAPGR